MILFQGLDDRVVPPNQAEMIVEALRAKKLPVTYVPFKNEQHGFRDAKNIKKALDIFVLIIIKSIWNLGFLYII